METQESMTRLSRYRAQRELKWPTLFVMLWLTPLAVLGADIYRWSDRHGEVHYGDEAPADSSYEPVELPDEGTMQIEQAMDVLSAARSAQVQQREKRFELCVNALRDLVHEERRRARSETPIGNGKDKLLTSEGQALGLELEPLITDAESYWKITSKGVTFTNSKPSPASMAFQREIREQCDSGAAVTERQLAAVNALIQEQNCQRLRTYVAWAKQSTTSTAAQLTPLKQALKQQCG